MVKQKNISLNSKEILSFAKEVIQNEGENVLKLTKKINLDFVKAVELILNSKGKIVVVGVGKNKPIAEKMVATLNSTGTRAQFLHAGEALHGDLGLIDKKDVVLLLSKSGNTAEIKDAFPSIKELSSATIAITGNLNSFLAKNAEVLLDTCISSEAGPLQVAPTTSTTVQLVMCDALAMCVKKAKAFTKNDFGKFHPGGSLGKQLSKKVSDIIDPESKPTVGIDADIKEVIQSLTSGRFGISVVLDNSKIVGVITDGDLRRMLQKYSDLSGIKAKDIATFAPKTINKDILAIEALREINKNKIGQLVVVDDKDNYYGIIDFHALTNEGISEE